MAELFSMNNIKKIFAGVLCERNNYIKHTNFGSLIISGKTPTYPSAKPMLTFTSHLGQNVGLGEG